MRFPFFIYMHLMTVNVPELMLLAHSKDPLMGNLQPAEHVSPQF